MQTRHSLVASALLVAGRLMLRAPAQHPSSITVRCMRRENPGVAAAAAGAASGLMPRALSQDTPPRGARRITWQCKAVTSGAARVAEETNARHAAKDCWAGVSKLAVQSTLRAPAQDPPSITSVGCPVVQGA